MKQNNNLEELCEVKRGLEFGKGALYNKKKNNTYKILTGEDIERYGIKSFKYIDKDLVFQNKKG